MNEELIKFKLSKRKGVLGSILNWFRKRVYVMVVDFLSEPLKVQFDKIQRELDQIKAGAPDLPISAQALDWLDFDNRFRGSEVLIKKRQKKYLRYFKGSKKVLDVGCGRGEFLELLRQNKIDAIGIDNNPVMIDYCKKKGLKVKEANIFQFFGELKDASFDGVCAFQVIEHFTANQLIFFLKESNRILGTGGKILLEAPNITTLYPLTHSFYLDPTHVKPYPPLLVSFLLEKAGFTNIKTITTSPVDRNEKLTETVVDRNSASNFKKLNAILYGNQDFAAIAEKP